MREKKIQCKYSFYDGQNEENANVRHTITPYLQFVRYKDTFFIYFLFSSARHICEILVYYVVEVMGSDNREE